MSWIDLNGRVAVVTGAAAGIGRSIAVGLAKAGAALVLLDLTAATATLEEVRAASGTAVAIDCDVTSDDSVVAAAQRARSDVGPATILINNAGTMRAGGLDAVSIEDWDANLSLNLTGYLRCAKAFKPQMAEHGGGSIVHIASIAAHSPQCFSGAYSVSKAGIVMMSQQLAVEWGPAGVRSNTVSPGLIRTPMTEPLYATPGVLQAREALVPRGRVGVPEDVANAVVFLASDRADYITGADLIVDGAVTRKMMDVIPRPGFERLPQ